MKKIGLYAGSFDPVTFGHLDLIHRALKICDELHVAVAVNSGKIPLFDVSERIALLRKALRGTRRVHLCTLDGLLVDYVKKVGATMIFRGMRAVLDFEMEFQMALMNRSLHPKVEVLFLVPNEKYIYLSSSLIKEISRLGRSVKAWVPAHVEQALRRKWHQEGALRRNFPRTL